jgi:6-phosphogluconolactonase
MPEGAVFVQTNEAQNAVVAFRRMPDGALEQRGAYPTGGAGEGEPHLASQGSVTLTGDGRHLLVTNAGSDDVSAFTVGAEGHLELVGRAASGAAPTSVAERQGLVYAFGTRVPALLGLRLGPGGLEPLGLGEHPLPSADSDPAQVGFTPDGSGLVVTDRGTDSILLFPVGADGGLGHADVTPSSGPTPYGFGLTPGGTLVVTEAFGAAKGAAAVSSYSVAGTTVTPVSRSVGNGRSEICWAVLTPDGRYAFTTNFADGAVSCYAVAPDGTLTLQDPVAGLSVEGRPGLRDEALTADGRLLYALDADAGAVFGWAVSDDGALSPLGSWDGLPPTVAGLAGI